MDADEEDLAERKDAIRALVRYDPDGIAATIERADSLEALIRAVGQLAHLAAALAVIVRTGKTES